MHIPSSPREEKATEEGAQIQSTSTDAENELFPPGETSNKDAESSRKMKSSSKKHRGFHLFKKKKKKSSTNSLKKISNAPEKIPTSTFVSQVKASGSESRTSTKVASDMDKASTGSTSSHQSRQHSNLSGSDDSSTTVSENSEIQYDEPYTGTLEYIEENVARAVKKFSIAEASKRNNWMYWKNLHDVRIYRHVHPLANPNLCVFRGSMRVPTHIHDALELLSTHKANDFYWVQRNSCRGFVDCKLLDRIPLQSARYPKWTKKWHCSIMSKGSARPMDCVYSEYADFMKKPIGSEHLDTGEKISKQAIVVQKSIDGSSYDLPNICGSGRTFIRDSIFVITEIPDEDICKIVYMSTHELNGNSYQYERDEFSNYCSHQLLAVKRIFEKQRDEIYQLPNNLSSKYFNGPGESRVRLRGTSKYCGVCQENFTVFRKSYNCSICEAFVCANCCTKNVDDHTKRDCMICLKYGPFHEFSDSDSLMESSYSRVMLSTSRVNNGSFQLSPQQNTFVADPVNGTLHKAAPCSFRDLNIQDDETKLRGSVCNRVSPRQGDIKDCSQGENQYDHALTLPERKSLNSRARSKSTMNSATFSTGSKKNVQSDTNLNNFELLLNFK